MNRLRNARLRMISNVGPKKNKNAPPILAVPPSGSRSAAQPTGLFARMNREEEKEKRVGEGKDHSQVVPWVP